MLASCSGLSGLGPKPLTKEVRASLGTVAVRSVQSPTRTELTKPYTPGQAAAAGALEGGLGLAGTNELGILLAPVGLVVGGVVGGMRGTPFETSEAAANLLIKAYGESDFQGEVRRKVVAAMRRRTDLAVIHAGMAGAGGAPRADTLLELDVLDAGLIGSKYKNGKLSLFLRVRTRLSNLHDGTVLHDATWDEARGSLTFIRWAEQDARAFRRELAVASRAVADRIVCGIFLDRPSRPAGWTPDKRPNKQDVWENLTF